MIGIYRVHRDGEGLRVARVVPAVGSAAVVMERDAHRGRAVSVIGGRVGERAIGSDRRLSSEQGVVVVGDLEVLGLARLAGTGGNVGGPRYAMRSGVLVDRLVGTRCEARLIVVG